MFKFFCKHETNEQIKERLLNLCHEGDFGIFPPPMDSDVALNELSNFFLGKNFNSSEKPLSLSEIVYQIKLKCKPFKRSSITRLDIPNEYAAIHDLTNFLLGDDYYMINPVPQVQANAEILYDIETKFKNKKSMG